MKKYLMLLLAGVWALSAPLSAQTTLGLYGGVNIANLGGDDIQDTESRTGLNLGASVLVPLGENVGLFLGGGYSQKGANVSDPEVDGKFTLGYIEFPVLLRYGFPTSSAVGVHVYGGGAVALETSCEIEGSDGSVTVTVDCDEVGLDTRSTDFGLVGGAGVDIEVSDRVDLIVDLFYTLGLTSIPDTPEDEDVKNRAFTIRAGVAIPLG